MLGQRSSLTALLGTAAASVAKRKMAIVLICMVTVLIELNVLMGQKASAQGGNYSQFKYFSTQAASRFQPNLSVQTKTSKFSVTVADHLVGFE